MKRKNSHRPRPQQLARLGIALVCIPLAAALVALSLALGWFAQQSERPVAARCAGRPFLTLARLHTQSCRRRPCPSQDGTLFLVGWHNPDATACIGLVWVTAPRFLLRFSQRGPHQRPLPARHLLNRPILGHAHLAAHSRSASHSAIAAARTKWSSSGRTMREPSLRRSPAATWRSIPPSPRVIETVDFFDESRRKAAASLPGLGQFPQWRSHDGHAHRPNLDATQPARPWPCRSPGGHALPGDARAYVARPRPRWPACFSRSRAFCAPGLSPWRLHGV